VALTDISGTIYDPEGLDLGVMVNLFKEGKPIRYYPPRLLHDGGYLLDRFTKRNPTKLTQQTLCYRKDNGNVTEDWLMGSEMNSLWRNNLHQAKSDVFIPAGGRPRTLNETTYKDFLDETGKPTSKAIVEGANLYLTPKARRNLEKMGVLIIKDSSANKCGVICSSFEVLSGLTLGDEEFVKVKAELVKEILNRLNQCALNEADLLLRTHKETGEYLTEISEQISQRINEFTYTLLDYLDTIPLSSDPNDPLIKTFLDYCLPILRNNYRQQLLERIPEHHKKAIIACHIASQLVYKRGLGWLPSIVDVLPVLLKTQTYE
jgi:glutamate dehydrogenase